MKILKFIVVMLLITSLVWCSACGGDDDLVVEESLPEGARVEVVVDKVETTPIYPEELGEPPEVLLEVGEVYAIVYLTLETVEGGRVRSMWADTEVLIDADGDEYKVQKGKWNGISLQNPDDFAGSPKEVLEGGDAYLVFMFPEDEVPSILRITYSFSLDWEEPENYRIELSLWDIWALQW